MKTLLEKYNVSAPRYTSYPTVPYWQKERPATTSWLKRMKATFLKNDQISLYIHLPFCESLCTYCGCNKRITKNHEVEHPYVDALLREWELYLAALPYPPTIKELHIGGGTPTFFSPVQLKRLLSGILKKARIPKQHAFGFEAHPASTTRAHLKTLHDLGFNRISIGVQDFEPSILKIINRHQTLEEVQNVVKWSRDIGYESINFDLIFGLPLQTAEHIIFTMNQVKDLQPDRIAFYSYAHVPWVSPSQRAYSEADLPLGAAKRALYNTGKKKLSEMGFFEIGMDHFAKADDALYQAMKHKTLHRNFMGYTPFATDLMIGLGASSISDSGTAFVQNEKKIEDYQRRVSTGELPVFKGHLLSKPDLFFRKHITNIMCHQRTNWNIEDIKYMKTVMPRLIEMEKDGLIKISFLRLTVTEKGKPFIRNIGMAFDERLWQNKPTTTLFSKVV